SRGTLSRPALSLRFSRAVGDEAPVAVPALAPGQCGQRCCGDLFKDFRAVRLGPGVRGAAVFAGVARDRAGFAASRTGNARWPYVEGDQEQQACRSKDKAAHTPADAPRTGKAMTAG